MSGYNVILKENKSCTKTKCSGSATQREINESNCVFREGFSLGIWLLQNDICCVGVMYSGEYDACDVTLSVYPYRASVKNMPGHGGNRTYDLWNTSPMLCEISHTRTELTA
jgi:hypothetical protein